MSEKTVADALLRAPEAQLAHARRVDQRAAAGEGQQVTRRGGVAALGVAVPHVAASAAHSTPDQRVDEARLARARLPHQHQGAIGPGAAGAARRGPSPVRTLTTDTSTPAVLGPRPARLRLLVEVGLGQGDHRRRPRVPRHCERPVQPAVAHAAGRDPAPRRRVHVAAMGWAASARPAARRDNRVRRSITAATGPSATATQSPAASPAPCDADRAARGDAQWRAAAVGAGDARGRQPRPGRAPQLGSAAGRPIRAARAPPCLLMHVGCSLVEGEPRARPTGPRLAGERRGGARHGHICRSGGAVRCVSSNSMGEALPCGAGTRPAKA